MPGIHTEMSHKEQVEGDSLIGTAYYMEILRPAEEYNAQTEGEKMLKEVLHRSKDVHRVLSAELIESREEVRRLKALVEEKRAEIEAIETEEKKARHAELERVRTEYDAQIKKQKAQADDLIRRLKIMDKTVHGRDRDIKYRDSLLEERQREAQEKDTKITELIRSVRQQEIVIGTTREERDSKHRDASKNIRLVEGLEEKLVQKDVNLRQKDEEVAKIRNRADDVARRNKDLERLKSDLEVAIEKTRNEADFSEQKLKMQLSTVNNELEEIKLQSEQFSSSSEFTAKTIQDLIDDNRDRDEALFKATQVALEQQIREQEAQDINRFKTFELQNKLKDLRQVDDGIMYAVTNSGRKGGVEPWRVASPQHTLVQCYPMSLPCVIGQPVTIIITTRNQTGVLVKGAYPSEFALSIAGKPLGSPEVAEELTAPSDGSPKSRRAKPDRESSTFTLTHFATSVGWKDIAVKFRGETLTAGFFVYSTAEEASRSALITDKGDLTDLETSVLQNRMKLLATTQKYCERAITVSCQPSHAKPGEEVNVYVVVRDPTTHRPVLQSDDLSANITLSPFFGGGHLKAAWMNCLDFHTRVGSSAVYQTKLRLPFDEDLDYTGVIATLDDWTASAICWMRPPSNQGRVDPTKTVVTCYPDPCTPGELVTATISTRGSEYDPVPLEDGQAILFTVTGLNGVSKISPVEKAGDNWRCTFRAERKGRSGITVDYSGQHFGQATVEVQASNQYVPKNTVVELNPVKNAKPGQRVYVTIKTKDLSNHLSAGPPPESFDITPAGSVVKVGGHKIHSLARGAQDGVYTTHFTVESTAAPDSSAGIDVSLEGAVVSGSVLVTADEGVYSEDGWRHQNPPLEAAFTRDPVRAEEAAFLVVSSVEEPRVVGGYNVMYVGQPARQKWCDKVWMIRVQIGQRSGYSSVTIEADGKALNASVTVDTMPVKDLECEIERLKQVETKFCESWDGRWGSAVGSRKGSRAGSRAGSRSGSIGNTSPLRAFASSLTRPESPSSKKKVTYPKIGIELADNAPELGDQDVTGARVVEVKYGEAADMSGICEHDILTGIKVASAPSTTPISCKDDFRAFLKELGTKAPFPTLIVSLRRSEGMGSSAITLELIPGVSETVVNVKKKKKRSPSRARSRSRSKSRKSSKTSTKKKKSTKKKSTKKKSTKKKKKLTSKKSTKKKSTKKRKSSTKKKAKGVMSSSSFLAARRENNELASEVMRV